MNKSELFEVMGLGPVWTLKKNAATSAERLDSDSPALQWWLVCEGQSEGSEPSQLSDHGQKLIHDIRRAIEGLTACVPACTNRLQNVDLSAPAVVVYLGDSMEVQTPVAEASPGMRVIGNVTIDELLENPMKKRNLWAHMAASLN